MRKSDYTAIAKGLAKYSYDNKLPHVNTALHDIFSALNPSAQAQGDNYPRFLEMTEAYDKELERLYDAEKSAIEKVREKEMQQAVGQRSS